MDDIRSILADLCRSAAPETVFTFSGFGQECWPVDVEVDLLVCMEQLPRLIKMLSQGQRHELDFYEQGLERSLSFSPEGRQCVVFCESRTEWRPSPAVETIACDELLRLLNGLMSQFRKLIFHVAPWLSDHPWVNSWLQGDPVY